MDTGTCHYCGKVCDLDDHTLGDCNAHLKERVEKAEAELHALKEHTRWRKYPDEQPVKHDELTKEYCFHRWNGNEHEVYASAYWCMYDHDDQVIIGELTYNFAFGKFKLYVDQEPVDIDVFEWTYLPKPPEAT